MRDVRAAIYARVSTSHHDQNPDIQIAELRRFCEMRDWYIVEEVVDHGISGGSENRPGLQRMLEMVRGRKIDVIVVVKLDRLARSLRHLIGLLHELQTFGIQFVSIKDQIDFTSAAGRLMIHILGAFAEFERALVRERTIAGLAYVKAQGRVLGRPRQPRNVHLILHLKSLGHSTRAIARLTRYSQATVSREIRTASLKVSPTTIESADAESMTNV